MNDTKYSKRYYSKEKYEPSIGAFGTGLVFLFVGLMSIFLNLLNIDFIGLRYWGFWMLIPAFFIILGGFHQIYTNRNFKKAVKAAIMDRGFKGTHKLEDIALEVGIKPNTLLRVLHDLRTSGFVKYRFNSKTGEIILGEDIENGFSILWFQIKRRSKFLRKLWF